MATAHLIHGYLGAGKTTLANTLERELGAVRFTPDEWMAALFGEDPPAAIFPGKAEAILAAVVYALACDESEALRRIALRNLSRERSLYIAAATFEQPKTRFEPLQRDEAFISV